MTKNIDLTLEYLKHEFHQSAYFAEHPDHREYRFRHSIRVANIGASIAEREGMDAEAMTIACLLHDVSYALDFRSKEDWENHGRTSARMARDFLGRLAIPQERKAEICYGIAIHVDDKADFEGERNAFAQTVGDSDNIDRFDVYRIYEHLKESDFSALAHDEQLLYVAKKIKRCEELKDLQFGTPTGAAMWRERLAYQADFYAKLQAQLENGDSLRVGNACGDTEIGR
jgi:uncharacterized protein